MHSTAVESFVLLGVGVGIILLRTYARLSAVGVRKFQADDYLMLGAAVLYGLETHMAYGVGAEWGGLANNFMTHEQRAALALHPESEEYHKRVAGSKLLIAAWMVYTLLLWILKAAMCTFYIRLTEGLDYRRRINTGFVLIAVTWVMVVLSILLGCRPFRKNWQINPDPGLHCQPAEARLNIFMTLLLNIFTDIYLMTIPIPMLLRSTLRPTRKFGLVMLFSAGILIMVAGIIRCIEIITNPSSDAQQTASWGCRETFVAIMTTNLPILVPLLRKHVWPFLRSFGSTQSRSKRTQPRTNVPAVRRGSRPADVEMGNYSYVVRGRWNGEASPQVTGATSLDGGSQNLYHRALRSPVDGVRKTVSYKIEWDDELHGSAMRGAALGNMTYVTAQRSYFNFD